MEVRDVPGTDRLKVGRLKPGENDLIHLFVDGVSELMMVTRQEAERLGALAGETVVVAWVDGMKYWVFLGGRFEICWINGRGRRWRCIGRGDNICE